MSYFLWIEDFENSAKATASNLFGGIVGEQNFSDNTRQLKKYLKEHGVFIELSFQDGLGFVRNNLNKIDYIILDIDLPACTKGDEINDDVLQLLEKFHDYKKLNNESGDERFLGEKCEELKKLAGYYIYAELVIELGFPKEHILFCSNHGENLKSIQEAFRTAKITLPTIYKKSDYEAHAWVVKNYSNPYSRLRRGIIEGCKYLRTLTEDKISFNSFVKEPEKHYSLNELHDYLIVLEKFLPLTVQSNSDEAALYKLFIRILAHEWEAAEPKALEAPDTQHKQQELFAFSWTMKIARNWSAHSKVFENLKPQDVAYLFIINMRAMFDLGDKLLPYEENLLKLFKNTISKDEFIEKIGNKHDDRKIPFIENYADLLDKSGNTYRAINFHDILNELQRSKKETNHDFLIKGIYQIFWFLTSIGRVYIPSDKEKIKNFRALYYQFKYFDYRKEYIFEIGRHIYSSSFI